MITNVQALLHVPGIGKLREHMIECLYLFPRPERHERLVLFLDIDINMLRPVQLFVPVLKSLENLFLLN